jgi:hypothetical protein
MLLTVPAGAQRIHGYVAAGATLSQIEGDELKGFRMLGFSGGVGAITSFDRNGRWSFSIETLFSQRGAYNITGDPYSVSIGLNYIEIPLLLHFRDPWGGMLFGLGLSYGRLLQQPHNNIYYDPQYFFPDTNDMTFNKNDLMIAADVRFPIWRELLFNIRWQYSIVAVKNDWEFTQIEGDNQVKKWKNDCYNNSLFFRLIWQF